MISLMQKLPNWMHTSWDALLLFILACFLLYTQLDAPLLEPDEARYAEIPRLMLRSGDWITPKLQGKPYNDKPPLVYWLIAGSYSLFGVSIEAARAVPASAGLLTLCIVYFWCRRYLGRTTANLSGMVLLSMLGYLAMMRMLLLDGVLTLLVTGSLLSGHHALTQKRHAGWWLISAILCGLGVLAKGPVAIVLVTPCFIALRWLDRSTTPMRFLDAVWYGLVVLALAVPWYAVMLLTNESFGSEHFIRHHLQRFLEPAHHARPFWYYVPALILELLPWPVLLLAVCRRWREWTGSERFLVFFSVLCFIFFSIARAKLPTYLLPMLPVLAVLFGNQLRSMINHGFLKDRWPWVIVCTALIMAFVVTARSVILTWTLQVGTHNWDWGMFVLFIIMLGLIVLFRYMARTEQPVRLTWQGAVLGLCALLSTLSVTHWAIPDYSQLASVVPHCKELIQLADRERIPYAAHRNSWDAVSFHLNREEIDVYSSREIPALHSWIQRNPRCMVWMREGDHRIEGFLQSLLAGMEVEKILDLGHMQGIILKEAEVVPAEYRQRR